ncbi:hypothetical protein [Pedobacter agri]|uniref:hypothetical protein n=1 Tax=Pedobacter agri TaxID=454586 RepID=UPI00292FE618|nr:hypothetical protein [Pedobacter agri]
MKQVIVIATIVLTFKSYAQVSQINDLKSGKLHEFRIKEQFIKNWYNKTTDYEIEAKITFDQKKFQNKSLNVNSDVIVLNINKFSYHGKNILNFFPRPIEFWTIYSKDSKIFRGDYLDPVSKYPVYVFINLSNKEQIEMSFKLSERNLAREEDFTKGTVFPKEQFILYKKNITLV